MGDLWMTTALPAALHRTWASMIARGVLALLLGLLAFAWPGITLLVLVSLFGAYAFVDGLFALAAAMHPSGEGRRGVLVLQAILGVAAGIITYLRPSVTALSFVIVAAAWAILIGGLEIATAVRLRIEHEWLLVLSGAVSILFGVVLLLRPTAGALALVWMVGTFAVLFGVLRIALGFRLRTLARAAGPAAP